MLTIKKATVHDIPRIRDIADEVWPKTYSEILSSSQLRYMMDLFYSEASLMEQFAKHKFLFAQENDEMVGFASYGATGSSGIYKLHKLYVRSGTQARGIGRRLVLTILNKIRLAGATALDLNVNRNNRAKGFYEKIGFVVIKEEDIDIGNGYWMNDYVMRYALQTE